MKNMIIASTSTVHGGSYLSYLVEELKDLYKDIDTLVFIPYARPSGITHDEYTDKVKTVFSKISINVKGLHEFSNPTEAIENAEAIFTGGGNTFVLVNQLYKNQLLKPIKDEVNKGPPYLGTTL